MAFYLVELPFSTYLSLRMSIFSRQRRISRSSTDGVWRRKAALENLMNSAALCWTFAISLFSLLVARTNILMLTYHVRILPKLQMSSTICSPSIPPSPYLRPTLFSLLFFASFAPFFKLFEIVNFDLLDFSVGILDFLNESFCFSSGTEFLYILNPMKYISMKIFSLKM